MQLYYIRHGQSENNAMWAATGDDEGRSEDPELTEIGRKQAEWTARFLRQPTPGSAHRNGYDPQNVHGFGITHIYSSLMVRAVQTGSILAEALGLPLHAWEGIHECGGIFLEDRNTGERNGLPGKDRAYFATHFPGFVLSKGLAEDGWWNRPFESDDARTPRARQFVEELLKRHGGTQDRVVVISHGGFYNHVLEVLLEWPRSEGKWFLMNNTAITRIDFHDEGRVELVYHNRAEHLPRELIT